MSDRAFTVTAGDLHENGLSCDFGIFDDPYENPVITGYVKWDGCMNWETDKNCMMHFCFPETADDLAWAFREAWRLCAAAIGDKYDQNAPVPVEPPK